MSIESTPLEENHLAYALSVEGARHTLHGTPCEDASRASTHSDTFYLAVADGHGDSKHSLAHIGADLAASIAEPILRSALATLPDEPTPRELHVLKEQIEKRIRWDWNTACKRYLDINGDGTWDENLIAFGTTVLCCCGNSNGMLGFQLGDGDIVCVKDDQMEFMFQESNEMLGTVTHSLCQPYRQNQSQLGWMSTQNVDSILLTTDGLRDCMQGDRKHFAAVIPWLLNLLFEDPSKLPEWLQKISAQGNGDDISIAIYVKHSKHTGDQ